MKADFTVNPSFVGGGGWSLATIEINTDKGVESYNDWYGTERRKGTPFSISSNSWNEFKRMCDSCGLVYFFN